MNRRYGELRAKAGMHFSDLSNRCWSSRQENSGWASFLTRERRTADGKSGAAHSISGQGRRKVYSENLVKCTSSHIAAAPRREIVPLSGGARRSRCGPSAACLTPAKLGSTMLWWWGTLCMMIAVMSVETSAHLVKEFTTERREAARSMEPEKGSYPGEIGSLNIESMLCERYDEWSQWSPCSRKCEQTRVRSCRIPEQCGRSLVKEKRTCRRENRACSPLSYKVIGIQKRNRMIEELLYDLLYSAWTPWGPCTRSCRQRRQRKCKYKEVCIRSYIQEERRCQVAGSECEHRFSLKPLGPTDQGADYEPDIKVGDEEVEGYDEEPAPEVVEEEEHEDAKTDTETADSRGEESDDRDTGKKTDRKGRTKFRKAKISMLNRLNGRKVGALGHEVIQAQQECGIRPRMTSGSYRVVGGQEVQKNSWPWQVAILTRNHEQYCGGTLIAPRWVLTAAHCVVKKGKRRKLVVRIGEHDMNEEDPSQQDIRPEQEFYHPNFNYHTITNDIALIKLQHPPPAFSQPGYACLPSDTYKPPRGQLCTIVGWGKLKNTHIFGSDKLQEVQVPVVSHRKCRRVFDYDITRDQVCAGFRKGGKDSCAGDSGGPLLCNWREGGTDRFVLHGVTSYGEGCGRKGKYGIYTKVSSYLDWIYTTISENR